jgi:hypothetical protein
MRVSTTVLLLIAGLALIAGIFLTERYVPSTREAEQSRAFPLTEMGEEVDGIEFDVEGVRTVLNRKNGIWFITEPLQDRADPNQVESVLKGLRETAWIEVIQKEEMGDEEWKKTGLLRPTTRIKLTTQGRTVSEAWIGAAAAMEGTTYVTTETKNGGKVHRLARCEVAPLIRSLPDAWRDSKLVRFKPERVLRISLSSAGSLIEMARRPPDGRWALTKPLQTGGRDDAIENLLSTLLNLSAESISDADLVSPVPNDLAVPDSIEIGLEIAGESEPLVVTLRRPEEGKKSTQAKVSNRTAKFTATSESLSDLLAQPNDLRDNHLARLKENEVTEITLESVSHPDVVLQRQNESWFLSRHGKLESANSDRISILLEALNTHRIREFASDSASDLAAYGLNRPFLSVSWRLADKTFEKLHFGQDADSNVYAKYEKQSFVYKVAAVVLAAFPPDPVKWKGLNPLRFTLFALRRISLQGGAQPAVNLDFNQETAQWSGSIAGQDISAAIDRVKADRLADAMSKFRVQDWAQDRGEAIKALATPTLTFTVTLGVPGEPDAPLIHRTVSLAPTQAGTDTAIYYGQLDGEPDVFFVTREYLRELMAPVLKKQP